MMVHNIDNWYVGHKHNLLIGTSDASLDSRRADKNDLIELVIHELEQQRHLIQDDSHDKWCERCQHPSSYSCVTTNYKIDRRIKELRSDNDQCELCRARPMTTNCNNGRCDD